MLWDPPSVLRYRKEGQGRELLAIRVGGNTPWMKGEGPVDGHGVDGAMYRWYPVRVGIFPFIIARCLWDISCFLWGLMSGDKGRQLKAYLCVHACMHVCVQGSIGRPVGFSVCRGGGLMCSLSRCRGRREQATCCYRGCVVEAERSEGGIGASDGQRAAVFGSLLRHNVVFDHAPPFRFLARRPRMDRAVLLLVTISRCRIRIFLQNNATAVDWHPCPSLESTVVRNSSTSNEAFRSNVFFAVLFENGTFMKFAAGTLDHDLYATSRNNLLGGFT